MVSPVDPPNTHAELIQRYNEAILDTDRDRALQTVRAAVDAGVSPEDIVFQVVLPAMDSMVRAVSQQRTSIAQHFLAAQIADAVTTEMVAKFATQASTRGRVVIGNARGDLHALGKRILIGCLKARMIEVHDLGLSVPAERFVEEAVGKDAKVIAISAMMVHVARSEEGCLRVRRLLAERGLEGRIRLVVGGAAFRFDPNLHRTVGADAWAENAIEGARVIEQLVGEGVEA